MRAEPAFLQFDGLKVDLSMDLPVSLPECKHVCFNAKSYTECHKDKKGIKKAVTGLVSVPVSKTLVRLVTRWPRDEGTCRRRLVDE